MASTDDLIRQILEESKQRHDRAGTQHLGRGGQPHRKNTTVLDDIKSFKEPLGGLADAFAGALRGSVAGTVGFPGDLESLGRGALSALGAPSGARLDALISGMEQPTVLPTTERMRKVLPKATAYDNPYEELGTFMPLPGSTAAARLAGKGAKALGRETGRRINEAMLTGDGMLGAALAPVAPMGVVKTPGGNWLPESTKVLERLKSFGPRDKDLEWLLNHRKDLLAKGEDVTAIDQAIASIGGNTALDNFIDKQLTRYVKNQMATPEDPIRALAEKGTLHFDAPRVEPTKRLEEKRRAFADKNEGKWGYGQSQMAQNWEDASDQMINAVPAETYQNFGSSNMTGKPGWEWINKVDPDTPLYGLNNGVSGARGRDPSIESLGFPHLIDELRNATNPASGLPRELLIKPESLSKLSVPQAVERVAKINEWRAAQMELAKKAAREGIPVHKAYPEGYQWMAAPDTAADEKALKYITDVGCEGGWCTQGEQLAKQYGGGGNKLYVLHDPKGKAVTQISVKPHPGAGWEDIKRAGGDPLAATNEAKRRMGIDPENERELVRNWGGEERKVKQDELNKHLNDIYREQFGEPPSSIVEIKGKANRAPNEEYLPYVQDFVKSGQWSDVGDLHNTGLYRVDPNELGTFLPEDPRLRNLPGRRSEDLLKAQQAGLFGDKQYVTRKEWEDILRQQVESESGPLPPIEGMKRGGAVKPCNQDAMQMAVWDKAVQHKGIGGWARSAKRSAEEAQRLFDIAKGTRARSAQEAAGLYHPIGGGIKLSKPIELMEFETVKDPTVKGVKRRIITPEKMQGGIGIPLVGDRAAGGKLLTSLEGTQFSEPLTLEAGPDYMLTHTIRNSPESSIWRSGKGIISGLQKQVEMVRDMGRPIYGVNMVGSPTMVNYNTMVAEAILNQYNPAALTKKAKKEFLKDIRNYAPDADKPHLKPGAVLTEADMNDVEALRAKMLAEGAGPLRKAFVERMGLEPFQNMGFPDVSASRLATTEPLLVDVPTGSAGFTIGTIDPAARALAQTPRGHKTYPIALGGEYFGSLESPVDYRNIFQEFADKRRLFGKPEGSDWRSFSLAPQFQTFDQEWLDRYMKSMGASNPREWKKGGVVQKAKGGAVKKAARKAGGGAAKQLVKINPLPKSENLDAMRLAVMDKKIRKHHA